MRHKGQPLTGNKNCKKKRDFHSKTSSEKYPDGKAFYTDRKADNGLREGKRRQTDMQEAASGIAKGRLWHARSASFIILNSTNNAEKHGISWSFRLKNYTFQTVFIAQNGMLRLI